MPNPLKFLNVPLDEFFDQAYKLIDENMAANAKVIVDAQTYTKPQLLAKVDGFRKPYADVATARAELEQKFEARDAAEPAALTFAEDYATGMKAAFGSTPQQAAKFGIPARKDRRQLTVAEKMSATAKAAATRKKRGTLGKRQKEKIKATGDFSVTVGAQDGSDPVNNTSTPVATSPSTPSLPTTVSTAQPAPATPGSATASNGVVAPMLMNGSGH